MADNSTQKVISKITTILDRMDAETRANTLEQIATHIKELNNDMKIEETSNKNHLLKIKMNHNGFKRALPDTVKETLVANLWKNKCEISAMSYPGGCESNWISLMIDKSAITPKLWFVMHYFSLVTICFKMLLLFSSSNSSEKPKTVHFPDKSLQEVQNQLMTFFSQIDKEKHRKTLKLISKQTEQFQKLLEIEQAKTEERIRKLENSHKPCKPALPESLMNALVKDLPCETSVQSNQNGFQQITLTIKKSSLAQTLR